METQIQQGVIYCAIGEEHLRRAELSLTSLRKSNPSIKAAIYTNLSVDDLRWEFVITARERAIANNQLMIYKLDALLASPFQQTLYLDTDTFVLDDLTDLFHLPANGFPLAFCHGHNRRERYGLIQQSGLNTSVPYCFAPLQGGVILYEKATTLEFFQQVRELFLSSGYFDDQAILRELLWRSKLRFYILPPEYNFNSLKMLSRLGKRNQKIALPKIFHYTKHKKYTIESLVRDARNGIPRFFYFFHRNKIMNFTFRAWSMHVLKSISGR